MACACKVNSDLSYLQKKYGTTGPKQKETDITGNIVNILKDILVKLITILCFPLIVFYTIILLFKGRGVLRITNIIGYRKLGKNNG